MSSPPPRKPRRPPPRKRQRDVVVDALREIEADPEISGPQMAAPVQDVMEGEWLYKENDVVRGPVHASVLIEGAREGSFSNDLPMAREVGQWSPLHSFPLMQEAWEEGEREREMAQRRRVIEKKRSQMRGIRVALVAMIFLFPFSACALMSRIVVAARPWDTSDSWRQKTPPLIEIPKRVIAPLKVASLTKDVARSPKDGAPQDKGAPTSDEKGVSDDTDSNSKAASRSRRRGKRKSKTSHSKTEKKNAEANKKDDAKSKKDTRKKVAVVKKTKVAEKLSDKQVNAGLRRGFRGIKGCLAAETKRNDAMPATVTVAFSINNAGKAVETKVLQRQVRKGPLATCLRKAIGRITWPKTYGERRYVEVPFRMRKDKKK